MLRIFHGHLSASPSLKFDQSTLHATSCPGSATAAAKNTTAIQACESGSLFVPIATVIVSAVIRTFELSPCSTVKDRTEKGYHFPFPFSPQLDQVRVSRDREHGFQRIVSNDFRGS